MTFEQRRNSSTDSQPRNYVEVRGQLHVPVASNQLKTSGKVKINVKFTLEQAMKAQRRGRRILLLFL
jgi:hypothetical protein